jgi:DivIVA domain-containing protein
MPGTEGFDASEVARKEFATGFRGFDQYEVRAYLAKLAAEMGVLQERDRGLRERLTEIERKRPSDRVLADEEIEAALGFEATKVIHAAREAGSEIRARAEENVARLLREAQDESQKMRTEAAGLLRARTDEAEAAATQIVETAQQRGREMVAEAQAVRERMLKDLARRRRHAEAQVQLLLGGRERLVEALEQAARAAGETTDQLGLVELSDLPPIEPIAEGFGPSSPPVTPAPVVGAVPNQAGREASPVIIDAPEAAVETRIPEPVTPPSEPEPEPESVSVSVSESEAVKVIDERRAGALRLRRRRGEPQQVALEDDVEGVRLIRPEETSAPAEEQPPSSAIDASRAVEGTAAADVPEPDVPDPEMERGVAAINEADATARLATPVIEIFARLRADRATPAADAPTSDTPAPAELDATDGPEPSSPAELDQSAQDIAVETDAAVEVDAVFEARDAALDEAERALARSLKRALADEQNEVLDSLRRLKGTPRVEVLLPEPEVHRARYQRVAAGPFGTAAAAGTSAVGTSAIGDDVPLDELAIQFGEEVSADLRARLQRALDAGTGDAEALVEAISAGYREWKASRSEPVASHHTASVYSAALYASSPEGELRWVVDPAEGGCPDCDDNALAGPTAKGTAYPTGQLHPPAHVGCRCLLRPLP